jgi:sucrose-6-phosphate hydrolase SacC (GH32 family)
MDLFKPVDLWLNDPRVIRHQGAYYCIYGSGPYPVPANDHQLSYRMARSSDLIRWDDLGVVIAPVEHTGWDDLSIWTPGFLWHANEWYMYYTALSSAEDGRIQRIGLATSTDLEHWRRGRDPVIVPDPRYYEIDWQTSLGYGHVAWRDPAFYWHDGHQCWYGYITARVNKGVGDKRGCIGLVCSKDLLHWKNLPPAYSPQLDAYFEVPQLLEFGRKYVLLFGDKMTGSPRVSYRVSDDPLYWTSEPPIPLIGGPGGVEYSGWAVADAEGGYDFIHLVYDWTDGNYRAEQN